MPTRDMLRIILCAFMFLLLYGAPSRAQGATNFFLHGTGSDANPSTLFLNTTTPTSSTAKYKDSTGVNFNGGNPWQTVGIWPANPVPSAGTLAALSSIHVWLGLKNSDDQGTNFDIRAEISKNGIIVTSAQSLCITGITRNASNAKEVAVPFGSFPPEVFNGTSDGLSLKILTRIGTNPNGTKCSGHNNAVGIRLYFDATSRSSAFEATIGIQAPVPTLLSPNPMHITVGAAGELTAFLSPTPNASGVLTANSSVSNVATVPASVSFNAGQNTVLFPVTAVSAGSSLITVSLNGGSAASTVQVTPAPPTITSLSPNTLSITQGGSGILLVTISTAQTVDTLVSLSSASPEIAFVSNSTTIPAGQTSASFSVSANSPGNTQISANLNGTVAASTVTVTPTLPTVISVLPAASSVTLGATTALTVTISAAQPTDTIISVTATPVGIITIPATVTVLAGQTTAVITVGTLALGQAMVQASLNSTTAEAAIQVVPPAPALINLLPSDVFVSVGATGTFTVTLNAAQLTNQEVQLSVNNADLNHAEFGSTLTRADGMFDMAVNGGGWITVNYYKDGYLPVQRQVNAPWQDYAWLPDVVMIQYDTKVTTIDLNSTTAIQVAQGNPTTDADGTRTATLLFQQGSTATMTLSDGTTQPLTTLSVRATEYTVGANGPNRMPAALPPTSGYTYAVEFSADEAVAVGVKQITFSKPVISYTENFLNFPVGIRVPVGYYDKDKAVWLASDDGRVIKILSITNGMADIDTDGSNIAATATSLSSLDITDSERQQLATLYQAGQSLWRVQLTKLMDPDYNWAIGIPTDAIGPNGGDASSGDDPPPGGPCTQSGSIIGCETQTLGETIDIAGTPFSLNYQSNRVPGRTASRTLNIPLSGSSLPSNLKRIELEIYVAGRKFTQTFSVAPNQNYTFTWDGKDGYDRTVQGQQDVTIRIGNVYYAYYGPPSGCSANKSFACVRTTGGQPIGKSGRVEYTIWQENKTIIGTPLDARGQGLGGWTLNIQHAYDTAGQILYLGNGEKRSAQDIGKIITTVAGNGVYGYSGDGGPATGAMIGYPQGVAVDGQGNLFIADISNNRIRKVSTDGIITTVAGNGGVGYSGDGGPATSAKLYYPYGVAVDKDDNLYIADIYNDRIRKVYSPMPSFSDQDIIISSEDGTELYSFNQYGKHLKTIDTITGVTKYIFTYLPVPGTQTGNTAGYLILITDRDGNITTIKRDGSNNATAIVAFSGQRTAISLDANGYLATITNPNNETHQMTYTSDGLMTAFTNPRGNTSIFTYDSLGRLTKDTNAIGGNKELVRTENSNSKYTVTVSTGSAGQTPIP